MLLVHLNLAKHAGPAACYPPDRGVCDRLFVAADRDRSGSLDRNQFEWIAGVLSGQVLSRMLVYHVVLILCVPVLSSRVVSWASIPAGTYLELATQQALSCGVFFLAIPLLWNAIDARYSGGGGGGNNSNNNSNSSSNNNNTSSAGRRRKQTSRMPEMRTDGELLV